jgi:hypothetical protein
MASDSFVPPSQLTWFDAGWPDHERFPYNTRYFHVKKRIFPDLLFSSDPLIITGYTSLSMLLAFLAQGQNQPQPLQHLRLLLGHEPTETNRQDFSRRHAQFSKEFETYWLERGISLYQSADLLLAIDLLQRKVIQVRLASDSPPLHAKIYKGDRAITLGSSNFSWLGLEQQFEANVRFQNSLPQSSQPSSQEKTWQKELQAAEERGVQQAEHRRFEEACQLAERLWETGTDYGEQLLALLERLLRTVTWQEALARASAEVLEGAWAQQYMRESSIQVDPPLWPSQEQGITQAMWIIEHVGSVLVADATGSGKTQMGAHLIRAVMTRIWSRGHRRRHDLPVLISPANMVREWERTSIDCGQPLKVYSDGILSSAESERHQEAEAAIRRAQVLAVDEAHRYHNRRSSRTRQLYHNLADHVLLYTATPVNRGPSDLLALIDLLGADNFDDEVIAIFERLSRIHQADRDEAMSVSERQTLQRAIQQFTVRRTKRMLNAMIDEAPNRYRDIHGNLCRYPTHKARFYTLEETPNDLRLAQEILDRTKRLRGLFALHSPFLLSEAQRRDGISEEDYLQWRLKGAQNLAVYNVMEKLRSSRIALLEHLLGTEAACAYFGYSQVGKTAETGNMLQSLHDLHNRLPENHLSIPLPPFLTDLQEHQTAIEEEMTLYREIMERVQHMSDAREQGKVQLLLTLHQKHAQVIAFDDALISLIDLKYRLEKCLPQDQVALATGNEEAGRRRVLALTGLDSTRRSVIALCSDAMSEGLNMQGASVVVHLTMPTVIRIAEQRVGRVDRMNSPHTIIESYWPEEKPIFALRADERFFRRHRFVAEYLGSNLTLPGSDIVDAREMAAWQTNNQAENDPYDWQQIRDAFEPVRNLVSGPDRLIQDMEIYNQLRHTTARVLSSVSIVTADHPWAFFAIAGTEWGAPRWVYLDGLHTSAVTDLEQISRSLRQQLGHEQTHQRTFDVLAADYLTAFLNRLNDIELALLPIKKQRALHEMSKVLEMYQSQAHSHGDVHRQEVVDQLLALFDDTKREMSVDWSTLADDWLDLIRPIWYDYHHRRRRKTPLLLRELRSVLTGEQLLLTSQLEELLARRSWTRPLDERIVAAIVGIPEQTPSSSAEMKGERFNASESRGNRNMAR